MAPIRDRVKKLYIALESGGFGVDPSSNGSGYTAVKALTLGFPEDQKSLLDTNFMTGRNRRTKREPGPDMAQIAFTMPLQGLTAAAGDGATPAANDWLDLLLNHVFGTAATIDGEGISASGTATISPDTNTVLNEPFDLIPVYESGVNSSRTQWRRSSGTAAPYDVHRDWDDAPTGAAVIYGHKVWIHSDAHSRYTLAAHAFNDDTAYTLLGGSVTQLSLSMQAGQLAQLSVTAQFDNKTQETKASIPAITLASVAAGTPIQGELASIEFNGTVYPASSVDIDFGLEVTPIASVAGTNGRSDMKMMAINPVIKFTPQYQTAIETAFRAGTTGKVAVRFGAGSLASSVLNTVCIYFEAAQVDEAPNPQADGPLVRQSVTLRAIDPGLDGSGNVLPYMMIARA